jgi:2'-hydroxyisoflavone reductase
MKLLVLGGTRFLGRHLVEAALARAMDVTIFTRGRSAVPWLDRVTSLVGDRGPFDATDRFGYWVARFVHPQLLGNRPPRAVVPEPPERPLQFIEARDLAAWMLDLLERDVAGTFNAASPAWQWRMNDFVKALIAASPAAPRPAWIDEPRLVAAGVEPWTGLPMWLPASEADSAGFMTMNCERAQRAGLVARPLAATIADTADWLAQRDNANAWKHVLPADAERKLVSL